MRLALIDGEAVVEPTALPASPRRQASDLSRSAMSQLTKDQRTQEYYTALGAAISAWQNLEGNMAHIYATAVQPRSAHVV